MIEQEVTCEGDLFPLYHDFCLAALDLVIDTFSAPGICKMGHKVLSPNNHGTLKLSRKETPSARSEGVTSRLSTPADFL
jgi:hypothetical protein